MLFNNCVVSQALDIYRLLPRIRNWPLLTWRFPPNGQSGGSRRPRPPSITRAAEAVLQAGACGANHVQGCCETRNGCVGCDWRVLYSNSTFLFSRSSTWFGPGETGSHRFLPEFPVLFPALGHARQRSKRHRAHPLTLYLGGSLHAIDRSLLHRHEQNSHSPRMLRVPRSICRSTKATACLAPILRSDYPPCHWTTRISLHRGDAEKLIKCHRLPISPRPSFLECVDTL